MSGPPPFSSVPWRAFSDFPSEHHTVPPPGVSSSSLAPVAPPHSPGFAWSSAMALPASGSSPGVVMGTFPPHSLMKMNQALASGSENAHSWSLLNTNTTPVVGGVYPRHAPNAPNFASYGVQNVRFGTHPASFEAGTSSFGMQTSNYGGTQDIGIHMSSYGGAQVAGYKSQVNSLSGQIMNYESTSGTAMGFLHSSNASHIQNTSSMPQSTVESNLLHIQLKEIDLKSLIVNLKELVAHANDAAQKVASLVNIKLNMLPRKSLFPQAGVSAVRLGIEANDHSTHTNADFKQTHGSDDCTTASTVFNNMLKSLKENDSFYKDAPGVVQVPVFMDDERADNSSLPEFAKGETWVELTSHNVSEGDVHSRNTKASGTLLPSRFWLFRKEVSLWKDVPSKYSSTLLQAAAALILVKQADLKRWLLMHASSYGVAYSKSLATHIIVLLVFCLRAVHREAITLAESEKVVGLIECRVLSQSACWLSSQLSLLHNPVPSKNLVLGLFKFAFEAAAYCITFSEGNSSQDVHGELSSKIECAEAVSISSEQKLQNHTCRPSESPANKVVRLPCVGDGFLHLQQLATAVLAIQSEGVLVKCRNCDSMAFQSSSSQRSAVNSMIVKRAEEVRASRTDFKAVLEHDGLIWQRSQNQESKKNKTKEEILAEERDYKRRRMSYRGKKVQRTPSEILRDIIEGHMEEIVAAGGIGSFGRIPQDIHFTQTEFDLSASGTKDGPDADQTTRLSSRDAEGKELGSSYSASSRYSRSESRGSLRTDRGDGHRSISVSWSSSSRRNSSPYQTRYERSSRDHFDDKFYEREHESDRKESRREKLEGRERSAHYHSGKQYSSSSYSRDRSYSPM